MNTYKFVWKQLGTSEHLYECDADAMMAARETLAHIKNIHPTEQITVFAQNEDGKTYRFVVAYK